MIPISEMKTATAKKRTDAELWVDRFFARRVSIYLTWLLAQTPLSANEVTLLSMLLMVGGATCLGLKSAWGPPAGVLLMVVGYVLDCCDGEIARLRGQTSLRGVYLDTMAHAVTIPAMFIAAGIGLTFRNGTNLTTIIGAIAAIASTNPAKSTMIMLKDAGKPPTPPPVSPAEPPSSKPMLPGDTSGLKWLYLHTLGRLTIFPNSMFVLCAAVAVETVAFRGEAYGPIFWVVLFYALLLCSEQIAAAASWSREARLAREVQ